jgi:hypothetical protein
MTLLVGSVAGMALVLTVRNDPTASPMLLVATMVLTSCLGLVSGWLVHPAQHVPAAEQTAAVRRHTLVQPLRGL